MRLRLSAGNGQSQISIPAARCFTDCESSSRTQASSSGACNTTVESVQEGLKGSFRILADPHRGTEYFAFVKIVLISGFIVCQHVTQAAPLLLWQNALHFVNSSNQYRSAFSEKDLIPRGCRTKFTSLFSGHGEKLFRCSGDGIFTFTPGAEVVIDTRHNQPA